ncbi:hypothetical protein [Pedobacter insulae]|uniref:Uncharacterized protein n=1 Tax=Pedobacter insulae TaxID=414048 RepID=A0A1I2WFJ7_9SPHI|nr:hypothetical protein [Pedobacter insulae]SFH00054.1 hypothetical protein SAMN04489864_10419 [Pedobacter insulae]
MMLVIRFIFLFYFFLLEIGQSDVVLIATVNGYPLHLKELQYEMSNQRTRVYAYFAAKCDLGETALDWTKRYHGEVPLEVLKKRALEQAVAIKVQQIEMKKHGIDVAINYEQFVRKYEEATLKRKEAIKNGDIVFGPPIYTAQNYFNYVFSNQLNALKVTLMDKKQMEDNSYQEWLNKKLSMAKVMVVTNKW